MKRLFLLALMCLCTPALLGQVGSILPMPKLQFFDNSGAPLSGGFVYSYTAGTNTPLATYTDSTLGVPNQNPVPLDSAGRPVSNIWLSANTYKIVLKDANGVQIWSVDNVAGQNGGIALALSSPPPIGNVVPNYVGATDLVPKVTPHIDIRAYGAAPTLADNCTALQMAIAAAQASGSAPSTVYVPPVGTFRYSCTLTISGFATTDFQLEGEFYAVHSALPNSPIPVDLPGSKLVYTGTGDAIVIQGATTADFSYNARIHDLYIGASAAATSIIHAYNFEGPGGLARVVLDGNETAVAGWICHNCQFQMSFLDSFVYGFTTYGTKLEGGGPFLIDNLQTYDIGQDATGIRGVGIYDDNVNGLTVTGRSYFELMPVGIELANDTESYGHYDIHGNNFHNWGSGSRTSPTNTVHQRAILGKSTNDAFPYYSQGNFYDNDVHLGPFFDQGIAPYAIEFDIASNSFRAITAVDLWGNNLTGMTTAGAYADSPVVTMTDKGNNVVTTLYDVGSTDPVNLPLFAGSGTVSSGLYNYPTYSRPMGTATVSNNYGSQSRCWQASIWDGSANALNPICAAIGAGTGSNPATSLIFTQSGSTGASSLIALNMGWSTQKSTTSATPHFTAFSNTGTDSGTAFQADMADTTGTYTGKFIDFINAGAHKFQVAANGDITTNITGSTQCVHASSAGLLSGTGSDCGSGGGGGVSGVTGAGVISSTGGATPAISLVNSTPANVTTAYGTDVGYFTGSGGAATLNHVMVGDAQGGIKDGLSSLPVYTPHQLGLLCNNSDEGAAIQTALNGLGGSTGGVLQLQPGDYCNTGTTQIVWPKQVSIRGTGPEGTGLWGVYQAASSALTVGCALDNYGCIELIDLGNSVFENLAIRNTTTCATFIHQTLMVTHFTNVSFVGKQGTKTTNNACNDVFQFGRNITGCGTHLECYYGGYGSTYTAITTEQIRRGAIFNTASAFIDMSIVGSSTDSNSSADAQLISGVCNDAGGKCGFSSLACSTGNTITLGGFNGGGTGAAATVQCTSANTIADGTAIVVTANGAGYTSAPTTATGTCVGHTCSGTAFITGYALGPFVELLGYSGGGTNAIQNNILIFGEFGNASSHTNPGDGHYSSMVRTDFGGDNKAVVVGDDNASAPYSAIADFISTSNGNGNNFECLYYQTGGSEPTKCMSDSSLSSFHNHYLDGPANKNYMLTNYQAHLGDSTLPVNDFTSAFFTVSGLSTGTNGSVLQKWVSDSMTGDCTTGGGSFKVLCAYIGGVWVPMGNLSSPIFTAPALGSATATQLLVSGIVDGRVPVTVTAGSSATLGGTYKTGYTFNQNPTAAAAVTYTLVGGTFGGGQQYCVSNSWNGSAANTSAITLATSGAGQFIIYTDGTLTASGGNVQSSGAAGDAACVVGIDATHWQLYVQRGNWAKH